MKQPIQTRDQQLDEYRRILAGVGMPDKEKDDIIRVVEGIMQAFVDASFNINSTQISLFQSVGSPSQANAGYDSLTIETRLSTSTENEIGVSENFGI